MSPQYYRSSSNSGSSARLPSGSRGPFSKPNGSHRGQVPQYSQPRHTATLQEYHRASAQSMEDHNESPTHSDFYLSSMDHDSQYGQQTAQWNGSHNVYVSQDAMPTYQSTGRRRQNIASTESITPDSQFYSSEPSPQVAPTHGHVNVSAGPHFSASQVLPSTMVEVPMAMSTAPTFHMDSSYSVDAYPSYSQPTTQGNTLSFLSTQDVDNDSSTQSDQWSGTGLYSPQDFCAIIEDSAAGFHGTLPLSPPLSLSDSDSPPHMATLPPALMDVSGLSYGFQDEYTQGAHHVYSQDICDGNYPPPAPYVEEPLNERTMRASRPQPRPLLSAALVKGPSREDDDSPPSSGSNSPPGDFTKEYLEAKSNDDRSHPHYKAKPGPDGNYHCPYASQKDCEHRPTAQKCQYDKYLDSHLKPYRCKAKNAPQCAEARFSSTACRLRHEREAHGLHGHGKMPHLCEYPGCDRAQHDNGFPRRWNLYDHMKRVHNWTAPEGEAVDEGPEAPPAPSGPPGPSSCAQRVEKKSVSEKRKKVTKSGSVPMKKSRSGMSGRDHQAVVKSRSQVQQEHELRTICENFLDCKSRIAQLYGNVQLGDELGLEKLGAMQQELLTIQMQYRRLTAGQAADEVTGYA